MAKREVKRTAAGRTRPKRATSVAPAKSRPAGADAIFERVTRIHDGARASVVRLVNSAMVLANGQIGREMVETRQGGDRRGGYGERTVEELAPRLTQRFGRGFSATNLKYFRQFYRVYADRGPTIRAARAVTGTADDIRHMPCDESAGARDPEWAAAAGLIAAVERSEVLEGFSPVSSWSHYRTLMGVEHPSERAFYEIETEREGWSVAELERRRFEARKANKGAR